jgi:hypothetical protein
LPPLPGGGVVLGVGDGDVLGVVDGVLDGVVDGLLVGVLLGVLDGVLDVIDVLGVVGGGVVPPEHGALLIVQVLGAFPTDPVFVNSIPAAGALWPAASGPAQVGLVSE